jgi:hypothetical protein
MIFVNVNEILHFLFGYFARRRLRRLRRQAQTEETSRQEEGQAELPMLVS